MSPLSATTYQYPRSAGASTSTAERSLREWSVGLTIPYAEATEVEPRVDLLVEGGWVITMDPSRTMVRDGAVAVRDGRIIDVGPAADLAARWPPASTVGGPGAS